MAIERVQRPNLTKHNHSTTSMTSLNTTNTPSLAQTPTTVSSSLGTSADYTNMFYDFNTRPLPPRHDPSYSSSAGASKGVDLVMPHVAPPSSPSLAGSAPDHIPFHGGVWEKQTIKKLPKGISGESKEGLGALFGSVERTEKSDGKGDAV
jgi:ECL1/2/3 zinc binding proteins